MFPRLCLFLTQVNPVQASGPGGQHVKGERMTTLDMSNPGEVRLILRGETENAILTMLRRWPHWLRAEVEHDPVETTQCVAITLITDRAQEATIREILRRSFGLTFPPEGGSQPLVLPPAPPPRRRGFGAR
jgi:hypothetical protein